MAKTTAPLGYSAPTAAQPAEDAEKSWEENEAASIRVQVGSEAKHPPY